jgi:hypothetical protein
MCRARHDRCRLDGSGAAIERSPIAGPTQHPAHRRGRSLLRFFFADTGFDLGKTDTYTAQEAKVNITDMEQDVFEMTVAGNISDGWGAGPISLAVGGSYRKEQIYQIVRDSTNKSSDHVNGHPVLCNNDPEAIAAGLRGVNPPDCANTVGIQYSKVSNIQGEIKVKEAFVETLIPLVADQSLMRQMT